MLIDTVFHAVRTAIVAAVMAAISISAMAALEPVPEPPAIRRSVTNIENGVLTRPLLPSFRLSNDGRIGMHIQASTYTAEAGFPVGDPANPTLVTERATIKKVDLLADGTVILRFQSPLKTAFGAGSTVIVNGVTGLGDTVNANGRFTVIKTSSPLLRSPSKVNVSYKLAPGRYQPVKHALQNNAEISGVQGRIERVYFNLLKPEAYSAPNSENFHESADQLKILRIDPANRRSEITTVSKIWVDADGKGPGTKYKAMDFDAPGFLLEEGAVSGTGMMTLCENPKKPNPYACTVNGGSIKIGGKQDCYDLHIVTSKTKILNEPLPDTRGHEFVSTRVTVAVNQPKTTKASIDRIILRGDYSRGAAFQSKRMLEPMITADGRMLVFRIATPDYWLGDVDGDGRLYEREYTSEIAPSKDADGDGHIDSEFGYYNMVYSYNEKFEACDARAWSTVYPIAYAHHDPRLKNSDGSYKYGFAEYPFTSPEGEKISNNAGIYVADKPTVCIPARGENGCSAVPDIKTTYPWIDKDGDNIFMMAISETLHYKEWDRSIKIVKNCVDGKNGGSRNGNIELGECVVPDYPASGHDNNNICINDYFGCVAKTRTRYPAAAIPGYENDKGFLCKRELASKNFKVEEKWISINGADPKKEFMCLDDISSRRWWIREGERWSGAEITDHVRGVAVAGRWTKGKIVLLDGLLSNTDYGIGIANSQHRMLDLYSGAGNDIRVGSGRDDATFNNSSDNSKNLAVVPLPFDYPKTTDGTRPPGVIENINFIDSIQNTFNYVEALQPVTPRDVVWKMSLSGVTDEVAFDDYLDNNALIVSNMMASLRFGYTPDSPPIPAPTDKYRYWQLWQGNPQLLQYRMDYQDGWEGTYRANNDYRELWSFLADRDITERYRPESIRLQNAASSSYLSVPANGEVTGSVARIEPIASGGIQGRGFWLNGDNGIKYRMPDNTTKAISQWYVSLFVDNRSRSGERTVISFADGSSVRFDGLAQLHYYSSVTQRIRTINLTLPQSAWMHIALQMDNQAKTISLYIDGYQKDIYTDAPDIFRVDLPGTLVLGAVSSGSTGWMGDLKVFMSRYLYANQPLVSGFKGWIDDFKVLTEKVNMEVACNHANGTLMGIDAASAGRWKKIADTYPQASHATISTLLKKYNKKTYSHYACYHDYSGDYQAHLANIPKNASGNTAGIRDQLLKPEGSLLYDAPRPDFSHNTFCQSCHSGNKAGDPLSLKALELHAGVSAENDPRRQPMQPPAYLYGVLPANNWLKTRFHGSDKTYIDEWLMNSRAGDHVEKATVLKSF